MRSRIFWMILFVLWLIVLDQITKYLFFDLSRWADYFLFEPIFNTWISYGISVNYLLVLAVSVVVFFVILWQVIKWHISCFVACVFLAWLLGNLIDRVYLNWVRDFLVFFDWFIFNFADVYLTVAIAWFLLEEWGYVRHLGRIFSCKIKE